MKSKTNRIQFLLLLSLVALLSGCGFYSLSGINIDENIKTVSIQNFYNDASDGPPNLNQSFTETLKDYFQQNTNLIMVKEDGDIQLDGTIIAYRLTPIAPTASGSTNIADEAGLTRLTITVKTSFTNTKDEEQDFNKSFYFYSDFNPRTSSLTAEEGRMIEEIFEQIVIDIFTASVASW